MNEEYKNRRFKVEFSDLSGGLKAAIIALWVLIGLDAIYFLLMLIGIAMS
jgi:hypothetical protein